jgi:hypothetical protein
MTRAEDPVEAKATAPSQLDRIRKVSRLTAATLKNAQGEELGGVKDLIFDGKGRARYVIIGRGGLVGIGSQYVAIPAYMVTFTPVQDDWGATLNMAKAQFDSAPVLKQEHYQELMNEGWVKRNQAFFKSDRDEAEEAAPLTEILPSSKLIGAAVQSSVEPNQSNEPVKLGKLENLLLDKDYQIAYAIVGAGGVLGIGEDFIAVPFSLIHPIVNPGNNYNLVLSTDISKSKLESAPLVKGGEYMQLLDAEFVKLVNRHFGVGEAK